MIAGPHAGDADPDVFDNTGTLLPQDRREAAGVAMRQRMRIAMANAGSDQAHQHLTGTRWLQVYLFDGQRLVRTPGHRSACLHPASLTRVGLPAAQRAMITPHGSSPTGICLSSRKLAVSITLTLLERPLAT